MKRLSIEKREELEQFETAVMSVRIETDAEPRSRPFEEGTIVPAMRLFVKAIDPILGPFVVEAFQ